MAGRAFPRAFTAFPLLAFQLVFRRNLEFTLSCAFGTRCARQPRVCLYRVRGGVSPTYESGDKVTLRNCLPQVDEGELSAVREPRLSLFPSLPSYPPFHLILLLLNPARPRHSAISSCYTLETRFSLPRLIPPGFTPRDVDQREKKSRIYAKSLREGVLRNRYFVMGKITTSMIRSFSIERGIFVSLFISRFRILPNFVEFYQRIVED